ncbi:MAG: FIMAH domain-containing protein, partial [Actinophytocola sp.]|uniref:FIMAH domain-containing protein n=1 Tax=Actinophytocola sp. TaxID=1872138 RepID=UPI003D6C2C59
LASACLRALAKDPADRFPTAAAFAAAIRDQTARPSTDTALLLPHVQPEPAPAVRPEPATRRHPTVETVEVAEPPPPRRASRPVDRRPALLGGLAVALLAAVLVFWPDGSPARTGAGTTNEVPAQQAGPQRSEVAGAIDTLLEDVADATESGDILRDTARDLAKSVRELRKRHAAGDPTEVARRLDDLDYWVTERAGEGKIEVGAAATLRADIEAIATAAGISR